MKAVLLSLHVVAAIIVIGPITVAASLFPRYAREPSMPVAAAMHRITRGYAIPALAVPVFGIGVGAALGVLGQSWVVVSMVLTLADGVLLAAVIVPTQSRVLAGDAGTTDDRPGGDGARRDVMANADRAIRTLRVASGLFGLVWVVVVILMILRPGSTTGM